MRPDAAGVIAHRIELHRPRRNRPHPPVDKEIGVIEARGIGLVTVPHAVSAPISLIVDLSHTETARLPAPRRTELLGSRIVTVSRVDTPHFAASIMALMKGGLVQ